MLDGMARRALDPWLNAAAGLLVPYASANILTLTGLGFGLAGAACIAAGWPAPALAGLALCRLCDGLDGAVARQTRTTDFGGYLDIICDFVFYGLWPLAFAIANPAANALPAAALLLAFYINGASFLAFAIFAAKRGMETKARGEKSLYFTAGLAEGSETIAVFAAMCLWPGWFWVLAYGFAAVCVVTAGARIGLAWRVFG